MSHSVAQHVHRSRSLKLPVFNWVSSYTANCLTWACTSSSLNNYGAILGCKPVYKIMCLLESKKTDGMTVAVHNTLELKWSEVDEMQSNILHCGSSEAATVET